MPTVIEPQNRPKLFRYATTLDRDGVRIIQQQFIAIAETRCYYFVVNEETNRNVLDADLRAVMAGGPMPKRIFGYPVRKVMKRAARSFCFEDPIMAWNSFRARQEMRLWKLQVQMAQAEKALEYIGQNPHNPPSEMPLGHTEFTEDLNWNEY
ncbi:hypothetical protein HWC07_gp069 [Pantoea phage vB_PagM_LIET2]|uniref:Uncharacterized protein n=1 Tax=Pantoea phage vB_PagM_LIET2 TaxID=2508071 RepID=A0A411AW42_9CAUD|nr:hypothetical protein HWC07_gp069 [Pantoea phage vB_PagM_LIET2]QAX92321.1 hypothetical protein LIET2_gp069 [Pantoea phage vB_PagM_LIET2]